MEASGGQLGTRTSGSAHSINRLSICSETPRRPKLKKFVYGPDKRTQGPDAPTLELSAEGSKACFGVFILVPKTFYTLLHHLKILKSSHSPLVPGHGPELALRHRRQESYRFYHVAEFFESDSGAMDRRQLARVDCLPSLHHLAKGVSGSSKHGRGKSLLTVHILGLAGEIPTKRYYAFFQLLCFETVHLFNHGLAQAPLVAFEIITDRFQFGESDHVFLDEPSSDVCVPELAQGLQAAFQQPACPFSTSWLSPNAGEQDELCHQAARANSQLMD